MCNIICFSSRQHLQHSPSHLFEWTLLKDTTARKQKLEPDKILTYGSGNVHLVCHVSLSLSIIIYSILWSCYMHHVVQDGAPLLLYTSTAVRCVVWLIYVLKGGFFILILSGEGYSSRHPVDRYTLTYTHYTHTHTHTHTHSLSHTCTHTHIHTHTQCHTISTSVSNQSRQCAGGRGCHPVSLPWR